MSLHRTIHHPNGGYTVEMLHRSSGMVVQVEHGPTGRYLRQTAHTGLHDIESLEEWDRRKPAPKPPKPPKREPAPEPPPYDMRVERVAYVRGVVLPSTQPNHHRVPLAHNEHIIGVTASSGTFMPVAWVVYDPGEETS